MNKNKEIIRKKFPKYFSNFIMPSGAKEEEITVFRACRSRKCDKRSFLPTFEEMGRKLNKGDDPSDPGMYSLSTFEKAKDVKRFLSMNADFHKPFKIAIGVTNPRHGIVQRTKERTKRRTSHVDWWLYVDARPYEEFEIVDDFQKYL